MWQILNTTSFNAHYRLGGAKNKSYTIQNYTLLILSYQQIQLDKLRWNTIIDIIRMKRLKATQKCYETLNVLLYGYK